MEVFHTGRDSRGLNTALYYRCLMDPRPRTQGERSDAVQYYQSERLDDGAVGVLCTVLVTFLWAWNNFKIMILRKRIKHCLLLWYAITQYYFQAYIWITRKEGQLQWAAPTAPPLHSIFSQYKSVHQQLTLNRLSNLKFLPKEGIQQEAIIKGTTWDSLALEISPGWHPLLKSTI